MMPEYNGKPAEGLAKLRQLKTGAIPALFHHEEVGDIGLMWGRPEDPKKDYLDSYDLAHIDTKHPGVADKIEELLKHAWLESVHQDRKGALEKAILKDGVHMLVLVKKWRKRGKVTSNGNWTITAYLKEKNALKSRMQNQDATSAITRDHDIWTSLPAEQQDSTPDWKKDLSKHKSKLYQGSKGDFFPEQRLIARLKNADRSTLLHESGHAFLSMEMGVAAELAKLSNRTAEQDAYLQSMQQMFDWFGVKSLDDWMVMYAEEQCSNHEKFARSFLGLRHGGQGSGLRA